MSVSTNVALPNATTSSHCRDIRVKCLQKVATRLRGFTRSIIPVRAGFPASAWSDLHTAEEGLESYHLFAIANKLSGLSSLRLRDSL